MSATELWLYVMTKQRAVKTPREGTNVTVYLVTAKWTASVEVNMLIPFILVCPQLSVRYLGHRFQA